MNLIPTATPATDSLAVILPAAGASARFGNGRDKLLEVLAGKTVLCRSVEAFLSRTDVQRLVIATRDPSATDHLRKVIGPSFDDPRLIICTGADSRAGSVLAALQQVPPSIHWIAVHDAARPLVSQDLITRTLAAARAHGAAVPAMPVTLTIKQAAGPLPAPVIQTLPRQQLWAMQTPQVARRADLLEAFEHCTIPLSQVTDDVQLIELAGKPVWLVAGEERNLKLTTAMDLALAEALVTQLVK